MINAFRAVRSHPPAVFPTPLPSHFGRNTSVVRFSSKMEASQPENNDNMEKSKGPKEKTGDVMSHSFGEGYATRSDEEGFGGIYGGNQTTPSIDIDKEIHANHPAYDKTQGSEVKEKEKGRNQTQANN